MRPWIAITLAAATLAAVPAGAAAKEKPTPQERLAKLLEGRVAGEPQRCISTPAITDTQVIDKTAIVYRQGNTLWVNTPRSGAESLDDDDVLVTKQTGSQLCSIDTVQLHDRTSRTWRGFVALGDFVPWRKVDKAAKN
ncbi:MAG: hypothetical protein CVT74_08240 [Alphaproteobacteria bacterium HGW-Alphaproteobacteria-13]|jgi:hypothetical protein|nr:MAG: hypothetical protein CVT74_08240 [Alphaproteobacteria bacterium HGW-Alphaproteobacteria-13]